MADSDKSMNLYDRAGHPAPTAVDCGGAVFGGGEFQIIAGPCSVESEDQVIRIARAVKAAGATLLRGGAFKPRTSPRSFQGLGAEGIRYLLEAKRETGLPVVTELMNINNIELFNDVDVIQIGARNMQNFDLLKELAAHTRKPVLLKRGFAATIGELLMSAEYLLEGGNPNVVLCERGIRTFSRDTRNTPDLVAVPVLHERTHLPVIVDPSHATGAARFVKPVACAAAAIGADGLIVEVHDDPAHALCDGDQSLTPDQFGEMVRAVKSILPNACK